MPFYADAQFNTPVLVPALGTASATAIGTGTAVANALTVVQFPPFIRRTKVNNVQVAVIAAPNGGATAEVINFLNGTNTFAIATIGTLTAGQVVTAAAISTLGTFAAGGIITGTAVCTVTSGGVSGGQFGIWLDQQEIYA